MSVGSRVMSLAISSTEFIPRLDISPKVSPSLRSSDANRSPFSIRPAITIAKGPNLDPMIKGWGSRSLITPIPIEPFIRL